MQNTWLVITPPIIVLLLSFLTHKVALSLLVGILSAALIFHDFSPLGALVTVKDRFLETIEIQNLFSWHAFTESFSLFIYLFLIFLGIIMIIMQKTGSSKAYSDFVQKKLTDKKSAETSSLLLSSVLFIDDYLQASTVGSVMHPITDRFKIPRIKISFLVNIMTASLCIIIPISSWGAFILAQLDNSGVMDSVSKGTLIIASPIHIMLKAVPFAFYSFIIFATTLFIVRKGISFGPMKKHEDIANKTGNLFGGKTKAAKTTKIPADKQSSLIDFLLPIATIVGIVLGLLLMTGIDSAAALCIGSTVSLIFSTVYFLYRKKLCYKELPAICWEGIELMKGCIIVITLAWTFSNILTKDLATGQFLASTLTGLLSIKLFPLILFVATTFTTLAIGSAWGSMGLMIPITIPLLISLSNAATPIPSAAIPIIFPTISAILAGSVAGIHLSPISDIVILASTSTGAHHMDHVKAQQAYVMPIFASSCVAFLLSGFLIHMPLYMNALLSSGTGIILSIIACTILNKTQS